ncbi:MAG: hypothetical protein KBT03_02940 [Bacteroidales bacterium]|nr:hypothetical protein [Candidatus Scybalousia scybalohippi]
MKNFKSYDITCALTHDLRVCEHCKKCGKFPDVRMEMADYVERLEKALDKACWHLQEYEKDLKKKDVNQPTDTKEQWKEYLLIESEKQ